MKSHHTNTFMRIISFIVPVFIVSISYANPVLNNVVSGNINVQQSGKVLQVNQSTQQGIISWNSFNINSGEKTQFNQPNARAITLNRINPQQGVSQILGQLTANGTIVLINGAGLYFGTGAVVNVGSIIASTTDISNANFLAGKYIFDKPSTYASKIINKGTITASDYGVVALLGAEIENDGLIRARLGTIALGSGSEFVLDFNGDKLITFAVTAPTARGAVTNTGKLIANGGQILVTAQAAQGVLDNVINMSGYAEARSSSKMPNGSIVLSAGNGNVLISGKLSVAGAKRNSSGGNISISGKNITLTKTSNITANAGQIGSGGNITIKAANNLHVYGKITSQGGFNDTNIAKARATLITKGNDKLLALTKFNIAPPVKITSNYSMHVYGQITSQDGFNNSNIAKSRASLLSAGNDKLLALTKLNIATPSKTTSNNSGGTINLSGKNITLAKSSVVNANAGKTGNGGSIIIKATNEMHAYGQITSQGGFLSGNGGSVETSGKTIDVKGIAINLAAAQGKTGTWLLDPSDLTISTDFTSDVNPSGNTRTASQSSQTPNLSVADLENALSTANILVQTTSTGIGGTGDITVMNNITWASGNTLTLSAYHSININSGVTISNSGGATLNLRADNTGTGSGTVAFNGTAKVNFSAGGAVNIYYNPASYTFPVNYAPNVTGATTTAYMLVNSASDLANINTNLNGNYALGKNLNFSADFSPLGTSVKPYTGQFDGQGFAINGLTIVDASAKSDVGLFGYTNGATISNLTLSNVNITESANASTVGAVAGKAVNTKINNVSVSGDITVTTDNMNSSIDIGGIAGSLNGGAINNSNTDNLQITAIGTNYGSKNGVGYYDVGGLAGTMSNATITHSSSGGTITSAVNVSNTDNRTAQTDVGGLVGSVHDNSLVTNDINNTVLQLSGLNNGGVYNAGGLVGVIETDSVNNPGDVIRNSYSFGTIHAAVVSTPDDATNIGNLVGIELSGSNPAQTAVAATAPGDIERDKEELNLIASYENYVSNVPPSSGEPMPVYVTDHVVVKEVASNCSAAYADAENNITLSEGCSP